MEKTDPVPATFPGDGTPGTSVSVTKGLTRKGLTRKGLTRLYRAQDVRELDRQAIEVQGIAGIHLMKRAGRAAFNALLARWPEPDAISVYCGTGNNAGDGYIIAALAAQRKIDVRVLQVGVADKLSGDALAAYQFACREGVEMSPLSESQVHRHRGVVVDALLGTGMHGDVRAPYIHAIEQINGSGCPVLAVDIPSGLCSDTGRVLGTAVKADLTVTFIGAKRGLFTGRGPDFAGEVTFDDLGVPPAIYNQVNAGVTMLDLQRLLGAVPPRPADAHKGMFGQVLVVGGDAGFGGAALMAAEAAARVGAGLVSVATRPEHVAAMLTRRPEIMAKGVTSGLELEALLKSAAIVVVGPGLGRSSWSEQMLREVLNCDLPLVVDADALNLLCVERIAPNPHRDDWILTPHPGEAARLLGRAETKGTDVQADRFGAVEQLQQFYGGTVILKGAGSLIKGPGANIGLAAVGNPGMASGGMGDVLSGVLGGLWAQGLSRDLSAALGVCLHGVAGDEAARGSGQVGLLATDLIPYIRELLNSAPN